MGQCKWPAAPYPLSSIGRAVDPVPNEAEPGLLGTPGTASEDRVQATAIREPALESGFAGGFDGTKAGTAGWMAQPWIDHAIGLGAPLENLLGNRG
ncbi:hypothetical protein UNPA324_30405 [Bradyrhizobium sp. UNPA324]|nr:hypothetical protein UNPA324_30405 [Bradyrhizobium sp. UNPA324]